MRIDLPGNLLLFGEYAVTLPGAIGVTVATEPRMGIQTMPNSTGIRFLGTFENHSYTWNFIDPAPDSLSLLKIICSAILEKYGVLPKVDITIDTTLMSYSDGRKKGMGSSAGVAAGVVYALIRELTGTAPKLLEEVFPLALECHRKFQGARGSGYDVITSLCGGAGIFVGGQLPTWRPISFEQWPYIYLVKGDAAVRTSSAVEKFNSFCHHSPRYTNIFLNLSSRCSLEFAAATTEEGQFKAVIEASKLNRWIGRHLELPSEGDNLKKKLDQYRQLNCPGKALGSGGEIGAIFSRTKIEADDLMPLVIAKEGLRCSL